MSIQRGGRLKQDEINLAAELIKTLPENQHLTVLRIVKSLAEEILSLKQVLRESKVALDTYADHRNWKPIDVRNFDGSVKTVMAFDSDNIKSQANGHRGRAARDMITKIDHYFKTTDGETEH
jgi:hypothetical protein